MLDKIVTWMLTAVRHHGRMRSEAALNVSFAFNEMRADR